MLLLSLLFLLHWSMTLPCLFDGQDGL
jgi:hypothetical protein